MFSTTAHFLRVILIAHVVLLMSCGGAAGGDGGGGSTSVTNNLVLNATRLTGVAPLAISFDTIGTTSTATSRPFHEVQYTWDFGDTGAGTWTYGAKAGSSKNVAYGPVTAHVFETAGTYTVKVISYDGFTTMTKTVSVVVTDPDTVFSGKTLCVSSTSTPTANTGGCPSGAAVQLVTSWSDLTNLSNTYKRILLKRGDSWTTTSSFVPKAGPGLLTAYGTGANPVVNMNDSGGAVYIPSSIADWRIVDVDFSATASKASPDTAAAEAASVFISGGSNTLILRSDISKLRNNIWVNGSSSGVYIFDSIIRDPWDNSLGGPIPVYMEDPRYLAFVGNSVYGGTQDHAVRLQGVINSVISNNTIVSAQARGHALTIRGSHSGLTSTELNNGTWNGVWTENVVVSDNILNGYPNSSTSQSPGLSLVVTNTNSGERLRNIVAERNLIKSYNYSATYSAVANNFTFRNNIVVSVGGMFGMIVESKNSNYTPAPSSSFLYNNTFYKSDGSSYVNGYTAIGISKSSIYGQATGTVMKNNIAYAPGNTKNGYTQDPRATFMGPSTVSSADYVLINNSTDLQVNSSKPWSSSSPSAAVDFTPAVSTYALSSGVSVPVWNDFLLKPLTPSSTRSMGAILN
ncbi:hypothetical protein KIK84_14415 [Curvibacter sp. CHRR-16]|uniref:PKD domain-containing protein n=1 Tax=Curvibacter sp. CHRR-16 TaxID=2835872 RepID=UPI001BD99999|nr:PKD domain-containing protein [Curvibacter sp. CHRR-16]MBT0571519.1 hypothetical protein [Curvibacter sp. CHRR-16]